MEKILILHSPSVAPSRALVADIWGEAPLPYADTVLSYDGYEVRIASDGTHGVPVSCYPTVEWDGRTTNTAESWADVVEWIAAIKAEVPPAPIPQTRFTRTGFMRLFTVTELDALIAANRATATGEDDPVVDVQRMWEFLGQSEFVSLLDPLTVNSLYLLVLGTFLTPERFEEIKQGVIQLPGEVA